MQDFAMKIITSGTTLAELGRDCHTQAMVCHPRRARCRSASALYTAPHVSPPRSCTRLRHRGIHIAPPACFGIPSTCHILPLQAPLKSPGACGARRRAPAAPKERRLRRQMRGAKVAYGAQGVRTAAAPLPPDLLRGEYDPPQSDFT